MEPFDALMDWEKDYIINYIKEWSNNCNTSWSQFELNHVLRFWNSEKSDLFQMFGKELILSKEVSFRMGSKELRDMMDEMIGDDDFITDFSNKISPIYQTEGGFDLWLRLSHLYRSDVLVHNEYDMGTILVPGGYTVDGKPVKIQQGCKPIRTLHKLCRAFGLDEEAFEKFRLKHSQILNTKELTGELCLSIHPLDYMTMSDNNCGWDSCMSWMKASWGDGGEYRLGTVEMMNSPCVVVAYLKSHEDMNLTESGRDDRPWNSKRWRQLVIINKDVILGNRQYPYDDESLQGTVLSWLRELATEYYGSEYEEELTEFRNCDISNDFYFNFSTCNMYNDIYDKRYLYVTKNFYERHPHRYYLNYSGVASCMVCGDVIGGKPETSTVVCADCGGYSICADCGLWLNDDCDERYWYGDEYYCEECFYSHMEYCEVCNDYVEYGQVEDRVITCEGVKLNDWSIAMCPNCYENFKDNENEGCIDLDELEKSMLWEASGDAMILRALYDTEKGSGERHALIQKILY